MRRLKAFLAACALVLMGCAHGRLDEPDRPEIAATAQFIIQALAPGDSEDYRWDAFVERVSNSSHWRPAAGSDAMVRRRGRLNTGAGVVATGDSENVGVLSIDTNAFYAVTLLEALRRAGADVSFQADYETYSEYVVTPPGRDAGLLTVFSTCSPLENRPAFGCRNYVTLTFNPF
jgi:hypothetical protein